MKITDKVKIGGVNYKTEYKRLPDSTGLINFETKTITIDENRPKDAMEKTLIHEIIHGIFDFMNIPQDEDLVAKIGNGLHMVIADNPEIFKGE